MNENKSHKPQEPRTYRYFAYVCFKDSKKMYSFGCDDDHYQVGDQVVVETIRGQELGTIVKACTPFTANQTGLETRPLLRRAAREGQDAVKTMLGLQLAHVGVNCADTQESERAAKTLCTLFGFEYKPGNSSNFAGSAVEFNKTPGRGAHGHIAIAANNVDRAVYHLGLQGVQFDESSRKTDAKGSTKAIYLQDEVCGFAIHLMKK